MGGALSAALAIAIFLSHRAGLAMDRIVVALGFLMIAMTGYVAVVSGPPSPEALRNAVWPDTVDFLAITTLVGAPLALHHLCGAHRLVDAGVRGPANVGTIARASVIGVLATRRHARLAVPRGAGVVAGGVRLSATTRRPPHSRRRPASWACGCSG